MRSRPNRRVTATALGIAAVATLWIGFTVNVALQRMCIPPLPPTPVVAAPLPEHDGARPTAAVLLSQAGTEITDFLAPYAILSASGAFNVYAVAPTAEAAPTNGGLGIYPHLTFDAFDAAHPRGADVVIVPNVMDAENPVLIAWLRKQASLGAVSASICEGARLLAHTGLIDGHEATTHFFVYDELRQKFPRAHWRDDVRYVADDRIVMSAGVTAAVDASLHLVSRFAGAPAAERLATDLGLAGIPPVSSPAPTLSRSDLTAALLNGILAWPQKSVRVPLRDGVDEMELTAALDAYSRTFAASSASTSPERRPVLSRHGLLLVPMAAEASTANALVVVPERGERRGSAFDPMLRGIAAQFGGATAQLVADQLQYPAAHLDLPSIPSPVAKRAAVFLTLLAIGAALGLALQRWRTRSA